MWKSWKWYVRGETIICLMSCRVVWVRVRWSIALFWCLRGIVYIGRLDGRSDGEEAEEWAVTRNERLPNPTRKPAFEIFGDLPIGILYNATPGVSPDANKSMDNNVERTMMIRQTIVCLQALCWILHVYEIRLQDINWFISVTMHLKHARL